MSTEIFGVDAIFRCQGCLDILDIGDPFAIPISLDDRESLAVKFINSINAAVIQHRAAGCGLIHKEPA